MNLRISNRKIDGLTRTEVIVVISIIAVLVLIFFKKAESEFRAGRLYSANINCINNLKKIGDACRVWEGNHGYKFPMQISVANGGTMELANGTNVWINFSVMSNELSTPKVLICPADADKIAATNFTTDFNNGKISYFVCLNADETYPSMFLSGDDNFAISSVPVKSGLLELSTNIPISWAATRHKSHGNILLADGSVNTASPSSLRQLVQESCMATNRLAIP